MFRRFTATLAGVIWGLSLALAAEPEAPKKAATPPQTRPSAPATQPVQVHPLLKQTTFTVDPAQVSGDSDLAKRLGPITVTINFYDKLPGFDLDKLSPQRRQRVLERANKEACTCGCKGDTVARCLVNDPACKLVKSLAAQIYEEERLRPETGK